MKQGLKLQLFHHLPGQAPAAELREDIDPLELGGVLVQGLDGPAGRGRAVHDQQTGRLDLLQGIVGPVLEGGLSKPVHILLVQLADQGAELGVVPAGKAELPLAAPHASSSRVVWKATTASPTI